MLILLPILFLLLAAAALALLGRLRPKFTYHWLVAAGGGFPRLGGGMGAAFPASHDSCVVIMGTS